MSVRTAVILAGGRGLRLAPFTNDRPKPMIEILNKPLLHWTIESLVVQGIKNIVIGVAYKKEKIIEYFKDGKNFGVNIDYSKHTVEGGTGQGFRLAISRFVKDKTFLAMNGDELIDIDLKQLLEFHSRYKPVATLVTREMRVPFGVLKIDTNADVIRFDEKPLIQDYYVSTGVYIFEQDILSYLPEHGDIERTTYKVLAEARKLKAFKHDGFWITVNNLKDLADAENKLKKRQKLQSVVDV